VSYQEMGNIQDGCQNLGQFGDTLTPSN